MHLSTVINSVLEDETKPNITIATDDGRFQSVGTVVHSGSELSNENVHSKPTDPGKSAIRSGTKSRSTTEGWRVHFRNFNKAFRTKSSVIKDTLKKSKLVEICPEKSTNTSARKCNQSKRLGTNVPKITSSGKKRANNLSQSKYTTKDNEAVTLSAAGSNCRNRTKSRTQEKGINIGKPDIMKNPKRSGKTRQKPKTGLNILANGHHTENENPQSDSDNVKLCHISKRRNSGVLQENDKKRRLVEIPKVEGFSTLYHAAPNSSPTLVINDCKKVSQLQNNNNDVPLKSKDSVISKRRVRKVAPELKFHCLECDDRFSRSKDFFEHSVDVHGNNKPFCCSKCEFKTVNVKRLTRHGEIHLSESTKCFVCDKCRKRFRRRAHLDIHLLTHTGERPFACDLCDYTATRQHCLTAHKRTHTSFRPFKCKKCAYSASDLSSFKRHMICLHPTGDELRLVCPYCPYFTVVQHYLNKHITAQHLPPALFCDQCSFGAPTKYQLDRHAALAHALTHKCHICNFITSRHSVLASHLRVHSADAAKILSCDSCTFITLDISTLRKHKLTHRDIKPHPCHLCSYSAIRKRDLTIHLKRHISV